MSEKNDVQLPFIKILEEQGYETILPVDTMIKMDDETLRSTIKRTLADLRDREDSPILNKVSEKQLLKINPFLNEDQAKEIIKDIYKINSGSLIKDHKEFFSYLVDSGYSYKPNNQENPRTIKFIDFENPENNVFHAIPEFYIQGEKSGNYIDCQGFINGFPIFSKEDKAYGKWDEALTQIGVYYPDRKNLQEGCKQLFKYTTLLIASDGVNCEFGTYSAYPDHFTTWRDKDKKVEDDNQNTLAKDLLNKETLLKYLYSYVLHSENLIIGAKHHQFYTVELNLEEFSKPLTERKDVLIFKSQGSGKTYDMLFCANAIRKNKDLKKKQVFWQDRNVLSQNLLKDLVNFLPKGTVKEAKNSKQLEEFLKSPNNEVIVSLIQKVKKFNFKNDSKDIINSFDEAQRGQAGTLSKIIDKSMPNSQLVGYTGTPIEITTRKFGKPKYAYTYLDSINDKNTVPVIYRGVKIDVEEDSKAINLLEQSKYNKIPKEYKDKLYIEAVTQENLQQAEARISAISKFVLEDFKTYIDTPYKAFLRASSRTCAYLYMKKLNELIQNDPELKDKIVAELVISKGDRKDTKNPFKIEMQKYEQKERVEKVLYKEKGGLDSFEHPDSKVRILVMVNMGSEGYNVPPAYIVYNDCRVNIDSHHNAWQMATRANRSFSCVVDGVEFKKEECFFVDFANILETLNKAISVYADENLEGFDMALLDMDKVENELKESFSLLSDSWKKFDKEKYTEKEFQVVNCYYSKTLSLINTMLSSKEKTTGLDYLKKFKPIKKEIDKFKAKKNADKDYIKFKNKNGAQVLKELIKDVQDNVYINSIEEVINGVELTSLENVLKLKHKDKELDEESKALKYTNTIKRYIKKNEETDPNGMKKLAELVDKMLERLDGNWELISAEAEEIIKSLYTLTDEEKLIESSLNERPLLNDYKDILGIFKVQMCEERGLEFKDFINKLRKTRDSVADISVNTDNRRKAINKLSEEFRDEFNDLKDGEDLMDGLSWGQIQEQVKSKLNQMMDKIINQGL